MFGLCRTAEDWAAAEAQLHRGLAAAVAAGALSAGAAADAAGLFATADGEGRAERALRQATHRLNEEGLRGSARPSLALAALLQRHVERMLLRVDAAVDLIEPIRDAQVRPNIVRAGTRLIRPC